MMSQKCLCLHDEEANAIILSHRHTTNLMIRAGGGNDARGAPFFKGPTTICPKYNTQ